jgi:hypothetical protein
MPRQRTITKLELVRATVAGQEGWIEARWERSDGSRGHVLARFRLRNAERWYIATLRVNQPTSQLLRDVPLARIEAAANNADPQIREWMEKGMARETVEHARSVASKRVRLKRLAGRRLDDAFYAQVAAAYRDAVAHGLPPAKTLAADSDTPLGTVNRWIARARECGYLPDAVPGKVSV